MNIHELIDLLKKHNARLEERAEWDKTGSLYYDTKKAINTYDLNHDIIGKSAIINKPNSLTHGKECIIKEYVQKNDNYRVDFDKWCGWYDRSELKVN
jgi:hypothetical protein